MFPDFGRYFFKKNAYKIRDGAKILIVRFDQIGDVILGSPFIHAVKSVNPSSRIDLVVLPGIQPIASMIDGVDLAIGMNPHSLLGQSSQRRKNIRLFLGNAKYDVAVVPRWEPNDDNAALWVAKLSGAPTVVAFRHYRAGISYCELTKKSLPFKSRIIRCFLCNFPVGDDNYLPVLHEADRARQLATALMVLQNNFITFRPRLIILPSSEVVVRDFLRSKNIDDRFLVIIAPGARDPKRQWPAERFAAIVNFIGRENPLVTCVVIGSSNERELCQVTANQLKVSHTICTGELSLDIIPALINMARLFIGNDSGLGHISSAVGTPSVIVSCHPVGAKSHHFNAPERFAPDADNAIVIRPTTPASFTCQDGCIETVAHCILGVSQEEVNAIINEHLWRWSK